MNESYEVNGNTVRIFQKKGRTLITCSCVNGTKFCNEPTICYHKNEVLRKLYLEQFEKMLDKLINEYKGFQNNKLTPSTDLFLEELNYMKEKCKKFSVLI